MSDPVSGIYLMATKWGMVVEAHAFLKRDCRCAVCDRGPKDQALRTREKGVVGQGSTIPAEEGCGTVSLAAQDSRSHPASGGPN